MREIEEARDAYLGAWRTMKVNNDLQTQASCPIHSGINVDPRTGDVRRTESIISPVPDRNTHHVETRLLDLVEIIPRHPSIPVFAKDTESCVLAECFPKRVLVNNVFLWPIGIGGVED
jgi:hypothetical protein